MPKTIITLIISVFFSLTLLAYDDGLTEPTVGNRIAFVNGLFLKEHKRISTWARGKFIPEQDFSIYHFIGTNFSNVCLVKSNFSHGVLEHCNFKDAYLIKTRFFNADLKHSVFNHALFHDTDFSRADLTSTTFEKANFSNVNLYLTNLSQTTIIDSFYIKEKRVKPITLKWLKNRGAYWDKKPLIIYNNP